MDFIGESNDKSGILERAIYDSLKDSILNLKLKPGEKISEMKVAAAMKCSRAPVRDGSLDQAIPALQRLIDEQDLVYQQRKYAEFYQLDTQFHDLFYQVTGKSFVNRFIGDMNAHYTRLRFLAIRYDRQPEDTIHQHQAIVDAIRVKDERQLELAMTEHLNNLYRVLESCWPEVQQYLADPCVKTSIVVPGTRC